MTNKSNKHSTKKKTVALQVAIEAAAKLAMGAGRRQVVAQHGVSARDVEVLRRLSGAEVEEFREGLRSRFREIQDQISADILRRKDEIPAGQLAVTLGIISDKLAAMESPVASIALSAEIRVNGMTRAEALERLCGTKRLPLSARPTQELLPPANN